MVVLLRHKLRHAPAVTILPLQQKQFKELTIAVEETKFCCQRKISFAVAKMVNILKVRKVTEMQKQTLKDSKPAAAALGF